MSTENKNGTLFVKPKTTGQAGGSKKAMSISGK
jgi:hypothetical protein